MQPADLSPEVLERPLVTREPSTVKVSELIGMTQMLWMRHLTGVFAALRATLTMTNLFCWCRTAAAPEYCQLSPCVRG